MTRRGRVYWTVCDAGRGRGESESILGASFLQKDNADAIMVGDLREHRSPIPPSSQTDAVTQSTGDRGQAGLPLCGPETKVQARELG